MSVQFAWFENAGHNLEYFHVIATRGQNLTFSISGHQVPQSIYINVNKST